MSSKEILFHVPVYSIYKLLSSWITLYNNVFMCAKNKQRNNILIYNMKAGAWSWQIKSFESIHPFIHPHGMPILEPSPVCPGLGLELGLQDRSKIWWRHYISQIINDGLGIHPEKLESLTRNLDVWIDNKWMNKWMDDYMIYKYVFCVLAASSIDSEQIETVRELKVVDIGVNSFSLSWRKSPRVTGYKISWTPFNGTYST